MINEFGKIISFDIKNNDKIAILECVSKSACIGCRNQSNCGVGAISEGFKPKTHNLQIPYKQGMEIGENIELFVEEADLIKSALLIYMVPLLFFILGAFIGVLLFEGAEIPTFLLAISSSICGFLLSKLLSKKLLKKELIYS